MIAEWWTFALVAVASAAVLLLPGIALGAAMRLRGFALLAFAPVITTALVGALAIIYQWVHVPWNWATFTAGVLLATLVVYALRSWLSDASAAAPADHSWWLPVGLLIGGILIATRFLLYLGAPDAISQTNDAVFHMNALRYILETQSASSLTISGVLGATSFYPAAWHGVVAVVATVTGAGIPVVVNTVSLVIAAVVWPLGISWFTMVTGQSRRVAAVAAVLSGVMVHFPMLMLQWGVLYPNELAIALVPAALAVVLRHMSTDDGVMRVWLPRLILAAMAFVALGLAQPVAVLTWLMMLACCGFVMLCLQSHASTRVRVTWGIALPVGLALVWYAISKASAGSHWGPYGNWLQAVRELLLTSQVELPIMPLVTVLVVLGLVAVIRTRRALWLAFAAAGVSLLMGIATSVANPSVRNSLLGPWYADQYRVAATLPLVYVPLMAIGLLATGDWLLSRFASIRGATRLQPLALVAAGLVGVGTLGLLPVVQMPLITEGIKDNVSRYTIDQTTYLSVDERKLIMQLPDLVPADATVIGNPSTGMGFTFALSGINAVPKTWSPPGGEAWHVVANHLRDVAEDRAICDALRSLGDVDYVLDFGLGETTAGRFKLPGLTDFRGQPGFELVAQQGDASLWRITACGL